MGLVHENADHAKWIDTYEVITGAAGIVKVALEGPNGAAYDEWKTAAQDWLAAVEECPPNPYEVNTSMAAAGDWPYVDCEQRDWVTCENGRELAAMLVGFASARSVSQPGIHARVPREWLAAILAGLVNAGFTVEATGSSGKWVKIRAWRPSI